MPLIDKFSKAIIVFNVSGVKRPERSDSGVRAQRGAERSGASANEGHRL